MRRPDLGRRCPGDRTAEPVPDIGESEGKHMKKEEEKMMAKYFRVTFQDFGGKQHTTNIATAGETPDQTAYAFATGYNGCRLQGYEEISHEEYRTGKKA